MYLILLNLLTFKLSTAPIAELPALGSGPNCPALLTHPWFSLVKLSYAVFTHILGYITAVHSQSAAHTKCLWEANFDCGLKWYKSRKRGRSSKNLAKFQFR